MAAPGEVLVWSTVKDLVAGAWIRPAEERRCSRPADSQPCSRPSCRSMPHPIDVCVGATPGLGSRHRSDRSAGGVPVHAVQKCGGLGERRGRLQPLEDVAGALQNRCSIGRA